MPDLLAIDFGRPINAKARVSRYKPRLEHSQRCAQTGTRQRRPGRKGMYSRTVHQGYQHERKSDGEGDAGQSDEERDGEEGDESREGGGEAACIMLAFPSSAGPWGSRNRFPSSRTEWRGSSIIAGSADKRFL